MNSFAPNIVHERLLRDVRPALAFTPEVDFRLWRTQLAAQLEYALGSMPEPGSLDLRMEWVEERGTYSETRFVFTAEPGADVPCHLLIPHDVPRPVPVVIALQGHTPGMHISLARVGVHDATPATPEGDRDFAMQIVSRGRAALVLEQRCFGERADGRSPERRKTRDHPSCAHTAHVAALLGRTLIGERVWDVRRAIDTLASFPAIDGSQVACMGNSGGGTTTLYAACVEPRIGVAMPSSYMCTYRTSLGSIDHCCDNYLPGALNYFDMPDLAGLIAPRPLVIVAGTRDPIFPVEGVKHAFTTIQQIYAAAGAQDNCALVIGDGGHRFYANDAWPVFEKLARGVEHDHQA